MDHTDVWRSEQQGDGRKTRCEWCGEKAKGKKGSPEKRRNKSCQHQLNKARLGVPIKFSLVWKRLEKY